MTSDFSFSQVTEVDKREPRESFRSRGREMNRPRLRNVPRGSLLSTEVTWEIQIEVKTVSYRRVIEKKQNKILFLIFPCFFYCPKLDVIFFSS